jgi:RHS repeat-associated protein
LVRRIVYAPYGSESASEGTAEVSYKYTDKEKDTTGLYYFEARYYDPEIGRFISVDPGKDGDNWYAYCRNNPVKYVDPTGKKVYGGGMGAGVFVAVGGKVSVSIVWDDQGNYGMSLYRFTGHDLVRLAADISK